MNASLKKTMSLLIIFSVVFNMTATPVYAWGRWGNFVKGVGDWTKGAVEDVGDWTEGAIDDVGNWTEGAIEDVGNWTEGAIHDVRGFLKDVSKGVKNYRRSEKPNINGIYSNVDVVVPYAELNKPYVNVLNESIGSFSHMTNVKEKQLLQVTKDRIKKFLKDNGVTDYWAQFAVSKISGASEGASVGQLVESILPFDFLANGKIADEIDTIVSEEGFENIDKTSFIQPENAVAGMEFKFSVDELPELTGPSTVMFKGVTSVGYRDKLTAKFVAGGVEYPATAFVEDNKVGFYARVNDVKDLSFELVNNFDAPENVAMEIAQGIQDTINDLTPLGDPISNQARDKIAEFLGDSEVVYEQNETDKKTGNKTKKVKKMPSMNEFYAAGDVGVMVSNLIYSVPVVGDILGLIFKSTGNDATLANIIRDVVDQKEVKSFLMMENPQLLIERDLFDYTNEALSTYKASVNGQYYSVIYNQLSVLPYYKIHR